MHLRFIWQAPPSIADGQQCCEWHDLILWASPNGEWRVVRANGGGAPGSILVTQDDQRHGEDLEEAKRMAQSAAMAMTKA